MRAKIETMKSAILRAIGIFGVLLFGILFLGTFLSPQTIEKSAKSFVKTQIEKEIKEKYNRGLNSDLSGNALAKGVRLTS